MKPSHNPNGAASDRGATLSSRAGADREIDEPQGCHSPEQLAEFSAAETPSDPSGLAVKALLEEREKGR